MPSNSSTTGDKGCAALDASDDIGAHLPTHGVAQLVQTGQARLTPSKSSRTVKVCQTRDLHERRERGVVGTVFIHITGFSIRLHPLHSSIMTLDIVSTTLSKLGISGSTAPSSAIPHPLDLRSPRSEAMLPTDPEEHRPASGSKRLDFWNLRKRSWRRFWTNGMRRRLKASVSNHRHPGERKLLSE